MDKSPDAFRTISEVAEMLGTPAHVLRFWESRFPQIRPVKRAGGRRYYRPADVMLLTGIKTLLHDQGMTIRGVQKILREQGVRHVAALSGGDLPDIAPEDSVADLEQALAESFGVDIADSRIEVEPESATIIALETALRQSPRPAPTPAAPLTPAPVEEPELPLALAAAEDQDLDLLPEEIDLFDLPDDDPLPEDAQTDDSAPEFDEILPAEPEIAGAPAPVAVSHPLDLARRLRQLKPAQFAAQARQLGQVQARLASLHAGLSPIPAPPIAPLP